MIALASDFDETLFFQQVEGFYKKDDLLKIKEFQKAGHLFGICTGRPTYALLHLISDQIHLDFYIMTSGALILDQDLSIIEKHCIPYEVAKKIFEKYNSLCSIFFQANQRIYFLGNSREEASMTILSLSSIEELKDSDIYGLSFVDMEEKTIHLLAEDIRQSFPEVDAFVNMSAIDIVLKGCSKGVGIQSLKKHKGIDQMCAIGDAHNDIPMLIKADRSFTFHRSDQDVKDKATDVVDSIAEAIDLLL